MSAARQVRNILFIMCDQLRPDYLGCTGHPTIQTPNIDALAAKGVTFRRAYCQAPLCGPSRASFYTGRYMMSHGVTRNEFPVRPDELNIADYLTPLGMRVALVGKTHMQRDNRGLNRLSVPLASQVADYVSQCGFEPFERDDGLHPDPIVSPYLKYNRYLRDLGYEDPNPWNTVANGAFDDNGEPVSGWYMRNAARPARVPDEHSETAYMSRRAIDFMIEAGEQPWFLHLSYIKPHWPYMVSEPYNTMYGPDDILPARRSEVERTNPHPVSEAFMQVPYSKVFADDAVRRTVIPTYMGLITQIDTHLGLVFDYLKKAGRFDDTMIVFTSDHGDYMGDHWLGEKDYFHEPSIGIPMIIYDPTDAADATRGTSEDGLVESIDLLPTFYETAGGIDEQYRLEGQSLLPLLRRVAGESVPWRDTAFAEFDFSARDEVRLALRRQPQDCRGFIAMTAKWKYVLIDGVDPLLFDLENDPFELINLGTDAAYADVRSDLHERIFAWLRKRHSRVMSSDADIEKFSAQCDADLGILIGYW